MMGHLNSFSASGGGNLNKKIPKIQMPRGLPGGWMLKLRFDWYITSQKRPFPHTLPLHVTLISTLSYYILAGNITKIFAIRK